MVRRRARNAMMYFALVVFLCVVNVSDAFSGGDIYEDKVIIFQDKAYKVNHTVVVHENATLTVEPGVKIIFSANATMIVYGTLVANGTQMSQILFTSIADNTSSVQDKHLFWSRSARLVDGNGYNEGRLEVLYNGVWGTVCNDGWTALNSRVACQELGFDGGTLTWNFGAGTGTIWMDDVSCRESDFAVIECAHRGFGSHNCGHWQDVGLVCTGVIILARNGRFQTLKTPTIQFARRPRTTKQESSLVNVKINEDKQHWMLNSSSETAIVCDKLCPYMENVTISRFFKAIEIHDSRHIVLNDIVIQNCSYGIDAVDSAADNLTSNRFERNGSVNTFRLSRIKVYGCHLAIGMFNQSYDAIKLEDIDITECNFGITVQRFTVDESSQHSVSKNKSSMASFYIQGTRIYKCKTGIYLYNLFTTVYNFKDIDIVDGFYGMILKKTQTSEVKTEGILLQTGITGMIIENVRITAMKQINVCDGTTHVTSPVQVDFNYYYRQCRHVFTAKTGHVFHIYVKVLSGGNLRILHRNESDLLVNVNSTSWCDNNYARSSGNKITAETSFYGSAMLYIVSRPALSTGTEITISGAVLRGFSQNAMVFNNAFQSIFEMRDSNIQNVSHSSIFISGEMSFIRLLNNTFDGNGNPKDDNINNNSRYALIQSSLKIYADYKISGNVFRDNFQDIVNFPNPPMFTFELSNSTFLNNTGLKLIGMQSPYRWCRLSIFQNKWQNNYARYSMFNLDFGQSSYYNSKSKPLTMFQNEFLNNTAVNIVDIKALSVDTIMTISQNTWQSNLAQKSMLQLYIGESTSGRNSTFARNVLINNTVGWNSLFLHEYITRKSIILFNYGQITFSQNCLENPLSPYEFATTRLYQSGEIFNIDARFNWWGSTDPDFILSRIFDFRSRNALIMVKFLPFMGSKNTSDIVYDRSPYFAFKKGNTIGGCLVRNMVLGKDSSPYLVTRDVIIYPNATLVIEKGVHVKVLPYLGFYVYGKLEMVGEENEVIVFNIGYLGEDIVSNSAYPLRLINGTNPWEGRLEVFYNNTWGSICRDGWSYTNGDIVCKQLGFQSYLGSFSTSYSGNKQLWLKNIKCRSGIDYDITKCPFAGWHVKCNYYNTQPLAVRCDPGYWRGIRFRHTAKISELRHITFEHAGSYSDEGREYNFVLQFDIHKQVVRDVEIKKFYAHGINIIVTHPESALENIVIRDNKYPSGIGIQYSTPFLSFNKSRILNVKYRGILFQPTLLFRSDLKILNVDSHVPLRYEDKVVRDLCNTRENTTVVGEASFASLTIEYTGYTSQDIDCVHILQTESQASITVHLQSVSSQVLSISQNHPSESNATVFTAFSNGVFVHGPGVVYIRYSRKRYTFGSMVKIFVFTGRGKEETPLEKRNRTDVVIENVLVSNCGYGIDIADVSQFELAFRNITLQRNIFGIFARSGKLFLGECYIMENSLGIFMYNSGSLEMSECLIKGGYGGIYIWEWSNTDGTEFYLYNSQIIGAYNGIIIDTDSNSLIARIINCTLTDHRSTVIYSDWLSGLNISIFHSLFERNRQIVSFSNPYYLRNFDVYFHMQQCTISLTQSDGLQFSFSNTRTFRSVEIVVRNNTLIRNANTIIKIEHQEHESNKSIMMIEKNMFINNTFAASGNGILEITGNYQVVRISNNQFLNNKCTFLSKFTTWTYPSTTALEFINNIMEENTGLQQNIEETRSTNLTSFSLGVFGCYFRSYTFDHNVFNNGRMDAELFIGSGCGTNYYHDNGYQIDARFNWWGTSTVAEIENRIFDFNDWNNRAKITFLPAATSKKFSDFSNFVAAFGNLSLIGGYLNSSVELTVNNSPYIVTSDLTVPPSAMLTIKPGVELHFYPRVGVLVLGSMFANGTRNQPIRFCSFSKRCKSTVSLERNSIRLTGGNFEESGKLEILYGSTWKVMCYRYFNSKDAKVACRQLGYEKSSNFSSRYYGLGRPVHPIYLNCYGNESSISDCPTTLLSYCNPYYGIHLECEDSERWGNIRISSIGKNATNSFENVQQSTLQNIQLDHSGALHRYGKASSIQVINGSPSVKHVTITNGNGMEIISPHSLVELENLTFIDSYWSPAISILGNRGSVVVTRCNVSKSRYGGLVMAPMENLTFFQPYIGFPDLCDPFSKMSVNYLTYIHFRKNRFFTGQISCAKVLSSPQNTTLVFRLLSLFEGTITINLRDGYMTTSRLLTSLYSWNQRQYHYKEFKSSSNSMYLEAISNQFQKGFLAEVRVLYRKEESFGFQQQNQTKCKIVESTFQENVASAIQYSSDSRTSTNLTITRNHFISSKNHDNAFQSVINISASNNDNIEISNNFIHDNFQGGMYIKSKSNQVRGTIVNNVITFNINGSEAILVEAQNESFAQFVLTGNDLRRNDIKYPKDLVKITNVWALIKENIFFDNRMRYVLNWESPGVVNQSNGYCLKNKFFLNSGSLYHTILIKGTQKELHYNFLVNPANRFELSTLPSNDADVPIDARRNWWGRTGSGSILKRIKDRRLAQDLPVVIYEPFLPTSDVFSEGLCPFGWILFGNTCYFNQGGAQTHEQTKKICEIKGGMMVKAYINDQQTLLTSKIIYQRWHFNSDETAIWVDVVSNEVTEASECWIFNGETFIKKSCDSLYPSICEKSSTVSCINACFHNGICNGQICKCYKGWEGDDCSRFHCKNVGNCGSYGSCVGPNHCKCRIGWSGRGCTVSYCPPFTSCKSCLSRKGCGWCDDRSKCLPGTAFKTDIGHCKSWFYYQCISVGRSPKCSGNIKVIDCESRLCSDSSMGTNKGTCQQCRDLENCYKNHTVQTGLETTQVCFSWNEVRCPKGFVNKDYQNSNRINNIVASSNVKAVASDEAMLYGCPVEETLIVVVKKGVLDVQLGQIISSTQAEGIFHKVINILNLENYALLLTTASNIEEVVSYSDFSQEIPLQQLVVQESLEDTPDEDLLIDVLLGNVTLNESMIHAISSGVNIYKCLGHEYVNEDENVVTLYIVIPEYSLNVTLKLGDVLVGNYSDGFLENVVDIKREEGSAFVHTELTSCRKNGSYGRDYKTLNQEASSCLGGDDLRGLKIVDGDTNVTVGDTIIGRESGSFLGKVISFYIEDNKIYVELATVISFEEGKAKTRLNTSDDTSADTSARRRRKRAVFRSSVRTTFKLSRTFKVGSFLTLRGGISFTPKAEITLKTSWAKIQSIGVILTGTLNLNMDTSYKYGKSLSYSGPSDKRHSNPISNKEVGRFCIPLPYVGCIPGRFVFDVSFRVNAQAQFAASMKAEITSTYSVSAGGIWRKGHGTEPIFQKGGSAQPSFDARIEKATASVKATLTPTFKVQWPMLPKRIGKFVSKIIKRTFGIGKDRSIPPILQVSISAPIYASVHASFCSEKCQDSDKNVEVTFNGGLPTVSGVLNLNLGNFKRKWDIFSVSVYETQQRKCLKSGLPCCIGENGKPGKINPETKECEEECDCDPNDSTKPKGVKMKDSTCKCDECPDGSLKLKRSAGKPSCPCLCADRTERQMKPDKSCPCDCTCADGSKDTIAWDGSCPCKCPCKGYENSVIGPAGCKCEDKCPVCKDGEEPVWVDRKCICLEIHECGVPPVCVTGRKGPKCNQPDCGSCEGCSRNGVCVTSSSCSSWCRCNRRWEGRCCERRMPIRRWGDPHLETLDGVEFDYFGIGEFWDCKSVINDFGMQTRFFAYKGASLTGAIALKVGDSVVTITTASVSLIDDLPKLRIDGNRYNLSTGERFTLANGTAILDVFKPGNGSSTDGTLVVIFVFQYKSGVTVSVEVAYSPIMKRQYLNIQFTPTALFSRQTEGICGFMDDDVNNDLIGPYGHTYSNPLLFADSWRVNTSHLGSGLLGSWSWNSSNFHREDVMDLSYTDPNHKPVYSLNDLPTNQVEKATSICESKGLEGNFLSNCIFDISVTNDTSFSEQQSLKLGCPNECTGKGLCSNTTCSCLNGWSGNDCSIGECGNCSRGDCVGGFCQCETGWEGAACDKEATCIGVDNCTSEVHGKCKTTDKCLCNEGYIGLNCSVEATCYNVMNCSSNGKCVGVDVCSCNLGWKGLTCGEFSCESLGSCSGNGRCIAFDVCECFSGWSEASCSIPDCTAMNRCSGNGECIERNLCRCFDGYQGDSCNATLDCSHLGNCSGNGVCLLNNELINTCSCYTGFTGPSCSQYDCSGVDDCSGNGNCTEPNLCSCNVGYEGQKCLNFSCEKLNRCSGRGTCVGFKQCNCDNGWIGASCNVALCNDVNNCSSNGICISPNKCQCYDQYDGANCSQEVRPNLNTPVFANMSYTVTVSENRQRGFHVLTIFANDSDPGKSGSVTYGIVEPSITSYFILDKTTGQIVLARDLDYENLVQTTFVFTVTATDHGNPTKSSEVTVTITVTDENDNCPVFQTKPGNYKLPLTIVANDRDSNRNGQVGFYVDDDSDPDSNFYIDQNNNELLARKVLQPGAYQLTIAARDLGDSPCIRELLLTITVDEELVPAPSVSTITAIQIQPSSSLALARNSSQLTSSLSISTIMTAFTKQQSSAHSAVPIASSTLIQTATKASTVSSPFESMSSIASKRPSSSLESSSHLETSRTTSSFVVFYDRSSFHTSTSSSFERTTTTILFMKSSSLLDMTVSSTKLILPSSSRRITSNSTALTSENLIQSSTTTAFLNSSRTPTLAKMKTVISSPVRYSPSVVQTTATSEITASKTVETVEGYLMSSSVVEDRATVASNPTPSANEASSFGMETSEVIQSSMGSHDISRISTTSLSRDISTMITSHMPYSSSAFRGIETQISEIVTATRTTLSPEISAMSKTPLLKDVTTAIAGRSPTSSATGSPTYKVLEITTRLKNKEFVQSMADENSVEYKTLREELESALLPILKALKGFVRIISVIFRKGSVLADVQMEVNRESTAVTSESAVRAIINASDAKGNIGKHLQDLLDIPFLKRSLEEPTTETDLIDSTAFIVAMVVIGFTLLLCLAIIMMCYLKNREKNGKQKYRFERPMELGAITNQHFDLYYEE